MLLTLEVVKRDPKKCFGLKDDNLWQTRGALVKFIGLINMFGDMSIFQEKFSGRVRTLG